MEQRIVERAPVGSSRIRRLLRLGLRVAAYVVVYGWSASFLMLAYCIAAPLLFSEAFRNDADAEIASDFLLALGAAVIVASSSLLLLKRGVRSSPRKLLAFFYGFEAPLVFLITLRLLVLRELTAGTAFVIGTIVLGCASVAWNVFRPYAQAKWAAHAQLVVAAVALVSALSLAAYYLLFLPPVAVATFSALFDAHTWRHLWDELVWSRGFVILWAMTGLLSGSLFLAAPFAVVVAHVLNFRDQARFHRLRFQLPALTAVLAGGAALASIGVWQATSESTTLQTLARVEAHLAAPSEQGLERLYRDEQNVKAALLDAYLAPYRYLGAVGRTNNVEKLYLEAGIGAEIASTAQSLHDAIARPFLYDGASLTADQGRAEQLYATLFDAPMQRAERAAIDHAFASTYERLMRKSAASVVDIDAKRVRLERQELTVRDASGSAEVTIHDHYVNLTSAPQEILYFFELPEDAAITGLWLGNTADRAQAFSYRVAPRGAAQKVYKEQVRRRIDPAVVEQVGPRQYRLRAYPVPTDKPLHLWMSYVARADGGALPTPHLLEKRNAFSDGSTTYALAGEALTPAATEEWVKVPARVSSSAHEDAISIGGKRLERVARGECCAASIGNGERVAVVIDRSRSMAPRAAQLIGDLEWLKTVKGYDIDVIYAPTAGSGLSREVRKVSDLRSLQALGASTLGDLLGLPRADYAAVFVLTDDDAYDRATDFPPRALPPLWIVHYSGVARAYPDAVADALQRRGSGVAPSLGDAFLRWQTFADPRVVAVTQREVWRGEAGALDASTERTPMQQIGAKLWIAAHAERLTDRERMHTMAQAASVVSPLSSMIVLVNDDQHRQLDAASKDGAKFDRSVEDGKEQAPGVNDPFEMSAAPEPEEWMLLFAGLAVLAMTQRRRRFA